MAYGQKPGPASEFGNAGAGRDLVGGDVPGLVAEAIKSSSAELQELASTAMDRALAPFHRVLNRAGARGEVARNGDLGIIAHLAFFGVAFWEQAHGTPPTDDDCRRMVRVLLPGQGVPSETPG